MFTCWYSRNIPHYFPSLFLPYFFPRTSMTCLTQTDVQQTERHEQKDRRYIYIYPTGVKENSTPWGEKGTTTYKPTSPSHYSVRKKKRGGKKKKKLGLAFKMQLKRCILGALVRENTQVETVISVSLQW